jgi:hypothetical protein
MSAGFTIRHIVRVFAEGEGGIGLWEKTRLVDRDDEESVLAAVRALFPSVGARRLFLANGRVVGHGFSERVEVLTCLEIQGRYYRLEEVRLPL